MSELKSRANPNSELVSKIEETNTLIQKLCDQKATQAQHEINQGLLVKELANHIKKSNRTGLKFSIVMVVIAITAFSLDLIQVDDGGVLVDRVVNKYQSIKRSFP